MTQKISSTIIINGSPVTMSGADIRARRKALGLTQGQLGAALGITGNTVARWERDEVAALPFLDLALTLLEIRQDKKLAKRIDQMRT